MQHTTNKALVSIIVRTKDRPEFLSRALASISRQSYRPIEAVVVNDGGMALDPATLAAALGDVALNYQCLPTNQGRAGAANRGIESAHGEYIGFLDDDDELYPSHLDTLVGALSRGDHAVAYTDVEMVVQEYSAIEGRFVDAGKTTFSKDFSYADLLVGNYIPLNSVLFRAEVVRSAQGVDENFDLYEDWDLLIRIAKDHPFAHLGVVTARYNQWSQDQQINRADAAHMRSMNLRVLGKHRMDLTPEMILDYRDHRDAAEAELRLRVQRLDDRAGSLDAALGEQGARLASLEAAVSERDARLASLEAALGERDARLAHLAATVAERDLRLAQIESIVGERDASLAKLEALARARDAHIKTLERVLRETHSHHLGVVKDRDDQLNAMRSSLGWRALDVLRRARERWFPGGSVRRRAFDLGLRSLLVLRSEGIAGFARRSLRKLRRHGERAPALARAAYSVFRAQGARAVLARVHEHLRRGGVPASSPVVASERYALWIARHEAIDTRDVRDGVDGLASRPTISILTPVYDVDPRWLDRCIESVRRQHYGHWQLCLHDDASTRDDTRGALRRWQGVDSRISISFGSRNAGIAAASNEALKRATGEFVALLDHDDELSPDALSEVAQLLNEHPDTDLVYSDEDRITEGADGSTVRHDPFFKPDWSPQLLFACMYTGHLSVYRRRLVDELGGFRSEFDFSQDYDLALRASEKTCRIRHLPKVLYHWRTLPESAAGGGKAYARASNVAALQAACDRRGYDAQALALPNANRVRFRIPQQPPLVSIVIPTDSRKTVFNCIDLLLQNTGYQPYEIIVVTHSALGREIALRHADEPRIRIAAFDQPFNFSLKCNDGAAAARGEYLLFFNDDVEAIEPTWLADMVAVFGNAKVGGVSPKLFYENDTIQYAGMITGVRGMVGTAFHTEHKDSGSYFNLIQSEREVSLLSGACLLMPKRVFDAIGGFDASNTPIMHSDVDLCCRIRELGLELVYTPFPALRHIGHLSLKETDHEPQRKKDKADLYLLKRWGDCLSRDPYHPENMVELLYHLGHVPYRMSASRQEERLLRAKDLLLVSHDLSLSGAPILLVYLAQHFRAQGYFVTVMSPQDGELARELHSRNIPMIIDATLSSAPDGQTRRFMAAFDLVVANTIVAWPSVLAAKESGTPVLWLLHESRDGTLMADEEPRIVQALAAADDVVFACAATRSLYDKYRRADNFRVIPYGARPLRMPDDVARADGRFRLVHIGSVERRKGQDVLLDALGRLPAAVTSRLDVVMIGRTLDPDYHETLVPVLRALPFVRYLGQIPHAEIVEHLAVADVFVSSSRDEVFPVTILEAMSIGMPVIATAVGGVPEMIRSGVDGIVVPAEDGAALAQAIVEMDDDAPGRRRMGEAARARFFDLYTIDRLGDRLLALIGPRVGAEASPSEARPHGHGEDAP